MITEYFIKIYKNRKVLTKEPQETFYRIIIINLRNDFIKYRYAALF